MEKIFRWFGARYVVQALAVVAIAGCAGAPPKATQEDIAKFEDINKEYSKVVQVQDAPAEPPAAEKAKTTKKLKTATAPKVVKPKKVAEPKWAMETKKRQPEIEDTEGFVGRRPKVDPFKPGEKITLSVNYFNVSAADVVFQILPFKMVNDREAYHLQVNIKTNRTFSMFYSVDNSAETYLDFETLIPQTLTYHANETKRQKESKTFFDWDKSEATQWRHEVTKDHGDDKKKVTWPLQPYSQNMLSALYYLRTFTLTPGKKLAFRVADEGKNYVFTGEILRREEIDTPVGKLKTVVLRPQFTVQGSFSPSGESLIWLTDDDRKMIVRVESKVKIGTLVAKLKSIEGPK
jgi:hypothetical protein